MYSYSLCKRVTFLHPNNSPLKCDFSAKRDKFLRDRDRGATQESPVIGAGPAAFGVRSPNAVEVGFTDALEGFHGSPVVLYDIQIQKKKSAEVHISHESKLQRTLN